MKNEQNMTKFIKITAEMAINFKLKYASSNEPIFKISQHKHITFGCRVIEKTDKAVFVYVSSFNECFGFWMPIESYETLSDGFIKSKNVKINYNNTIYKFN